MLLRPLPRVTADTRDLIVQQIDGAGRKPLRSRSLGILNKVTLNYQVASVGEIRSQRLEAASDHPIKLSPYGNVETVGPSKVHWPRPASWNHNAAVTGT